jgi:hypothetical protein
MDCPDLCLEAFWLQELEWVLENCHKRSCWKNSIGVSVPRPSKSFRLCLTVAYWLLECNKVPSWIEPPRVRYNIHAEDGNWNVCETLNNSQYSTRLITRSLSFTLNASSENLRSRKNTSRTVYMCCPVLEHKSAFPHFFRDTSSPTRSLQGKGFLQIRISFKDLESSLPFLFLLLVTG